MDIAAISVGLSQAKVQQQASLSVMKMVMDSARTNGNMVTELAEATSKSMEQSAQPYLGKSIDISV